MEPTTANLNQLYQTLMTCLSRLTLANKKIKALEDRVEFLERHEREKPSLRKPHH